MLQVVFFYIFIWWFTKLENRKALIARAVLSGVFAIISFAAFIALIVSLISTEEMILILFLCIEFILFILFSVRSLCDIGKLMKRNIEFEKNRLPKSVFENSVSRQEIHAAPAKTFSNYLCANKNRLGKHTVNDCIFELQTIRDWEKMTEAALQKNIDVVCAKYSKTKYCYVLNLYRDYLREYPPRPQTEKVIKKQDEQTRNINDCNGTAPIKWTSIFTESFFNTISGAMTRAEYKKLENLLDQPFDMLETALRSCKTADEVVRTKADFIIFLLDFDADIPKGDQRRDGLSYFLNCRSPKIVAVFSDIITYISSNVKLSWRECGDDEWDLNVSGRAKDLFLQLDDIINKKGGFFPGCIYLGSSLSDIWYKFLNGATG